MRNIFEQEATERTEAEKAFSSPFPLLPPVEMVFVFGFSPFV